jgi:hypothetical protein
MIIIIMNNKHLFYWLAIPGAFESETASVFDLEILPHKVVSGHRKLRGTK